VSQERHLAVMEGDTVNHHDSHLASINQPTNQSTNESTNESTNAPTNEQ
jgi:hypothetical protein